MATSEPLGEILDPLQLGKQLLMRDVTEAEGVKVSCLVCRHYQFRDHGELVLCTQRPSTRTFLRIWCGDDADRAIRRAKDCKTFDDMRPGDDHGPTA